MTEAQTTAGYPLWTDGLRRFHRRSLSYSS